MNSDKMMIMKRHEQRVNAMICLYQNLLISANLNEQIEQMFSAPLAEIDSYIIKVIQNAYDKKQAYSLSVEENLKDWHFHRLGYIEQAILLLAYSELEIGEVSKAIILDEAVELAKTYGDEDAYKLINGVLDQSHE